MNRPAFRPLRAIVAAITFAALLALPPLPRAVAAAPAAFARTSYWDGFVEFWTGRVKRQDGIVMFALGVGAVSLFIITRGKWKK